MIPCKGSVWSFESLSWLEVLLAAFSIEPTIAVLRKVEPLYFFVGIVANWSEFLEGGTRRKALCSSR